MKDFVQIILSSLYIYSSNISWAVLSYPSTNPELNSLNVASPSLTSEYWISTFKAYARPVFEGQFPFSCGRLRTGTVLAHVVLYRTAQTAFYSSNAVSHNTARRAALLYKATCRSVQRHHSRRLAPKMRPLK